jgi:hypothetical protein
MEAHNEEIVSWLNKLLILAQVGWWLELQLQWQLKQQQTMEQPMKEIET